MVNGNHGTDQIYHLIKIMNIIVIQILVFNHLNNHCSQNA